MNGIHFHALARPLKHVPATLVQVSSCPSVNLSLRGDAYPRLYVTSGDQYV